MRKESVLLLKGGERANTFQIAGPRFIDPIQLRDKRFLRFIMTLVLAKTADGVRLKVLSASYQYQTDSLGDRWIFRYDYERSPDSDHPPSHLHVRGNLHEDCLGSKINLEDVHFPVLRGSIEAVIRLLIDQFKVPCNRPDSYWRPLLAYSEQLFLDIAHRPISGRAR